MTQPIDPAIDVAALKSTIKAQGIEIRDLKRALSNASQEHSQAMADLSRQHADAMAALSTKVDGLTLAIQPLISSAQRLDALLREADRQDGMRSIAKWIAGTTFLGLLVSAMAGMYQFFSRGGAS